MAAAGHGRWGQGLEEDCIVTRVEDRVGREVEAGAAAPWLLPTEPDTPRRKQATHHSSGVGCTDAER
jgi:hypothetical protein